jgi:outer membrane protein OmpA-like peptidoglycan-associated protein
MMPENIKTFYQNHPWKSRIIIALLVLLMLLTGLRLALSPGIIYGATSWLKKQGIDSTIEAVNISIFDGTVSLINAQGEVDDTPLFNIGRVDIDWQWRPLSKRTVEVIKVGLDSLEVGIEQYTDAIVISGINIPLTKESEAAVDGVAVDEDVKTWAASIGEVVFSNLNICYTQHDALQSEATKDTRVLDYCTDLEEMIWNGTISYATDSSLLQSGDVPVSSTGNFSLSGLSVTDNKIGRKLLASRSNTLANVKISGLNNIHLDKLEMNSLSLLQRDDEKHIDSVRFNQLVVNDITLTDLSDLVIDNISVNDPGVYMVKLDDTDWEYQQWIPSFPEADKEAAVTTAPEENGKFNLSLNNVNIANSDLCYLDKKAAVYYCLTFNEMSWDGAVKYDSIPADNDELNLQVTGSLKLKQPNIQNQDLDRSLLNFASIDLSGLAVTGLNNIALKKLDLQELKALQRTKDKNDSTVTFDRLAIDDTKYSKNNIAVNTIKLTGLANKVSKNREGQWEHDKWIPETADDKKAPADNEGKVADEKKAPLIISLNELHISTDKQILFTDHSTQPETEIGLQNLVLDISSLYTTKPDTKSPFKLQAQTLRHSTIDIEGTVTPFAEKVSMDADGKLKGFDLRAISPTTKKTIGHIIQSGQLDADLDLKAVNGQLDSNIALSLYQFQMKAVSKEDAKWLDDKFGMPLNQTLVLLRDKDDSIHLDIPITGDVNNPDFDPMDAIIKATSKAATVTLITFYTPYGLIYAGGNIALNMATALNFDPVQFEPGSSEITANGKEQLDNLSKLLTEKPQVRLTLCGVTDKKDVVKFYPELAVTKDKDDSAKKQPPLTNEQLLKLNQLANDRQINSKNYLIDQHKIDHSRLILCEPEYKDDDDTIAGVEINI